MKRVLIVLTVAGVIVGAYAGLSAASYLLGGLLAGLIPGGAGIANILTMLLVAVMVTATLLTLAERKWSAQMQNRIGPNRASIEWGPLNKVKLGGLLHIPADVLKMLWKEDFIPAAAKQNKFLFYLAPMLAFAPVFVLFAVVPAGPEVTVMGHQVKMMVSNPDFGLLYILAIASLAVYGTALAGWTSNNKFALLGGVRASSQMISYEVALGLSLVGIMMAFSTVGLYEISEKQGLYLWRFAGDFDFGLPAWGIFLQPVGFILFFAAAFAETKRAPFDAPEGESEIIGYFVEYSGMRFGLFMISEFVEIVVLAAICTALFFGGWHLPFGEMWLKQQLVLGPDAPLYNHQWVWGTILGTVFWIKVVFLIWVQLLIRWTFPRFRYDQIQTLGWKMLLPAGLINVFVTGALILWDPSLRWLALFGIFMMVVIVALTTVGRAERVTAGHGHGGHGGDHGHGGGHGHGHDAHGHALPVGAHAPAHATATHAAEPAVAASGAAAAHPH